jgi:hypothetical protein
MKRKATLLLAVLLLGMMPGTAVAETIVTGGGGGIFPPGTSFNNVPINGLRFAFGVEIPNSGPAFGQFLAVLLGVAVGGVQQQIVIEGVVTGGSQTAANIATISGTCSVDMGTGAPPLPGIPFTATVTTNANDQGTLGLVIGLNNLPNATVDEGSLTVK